jgi:hypothetical protein
VSILWKHTHASPIDRRPTIADILPSPTTPRWFIWSRETKREKENSKPINQFGGIRCLVLIAKRRMKKRYA